ncbi:hypothetical protein BOX15_Mlig023806g1 [Macrostomum lignano]|uniref:Uncharacterized protein n=1 Tax=Macrostomum lignano TaxID=282301 RepID=A0A267FWP6_9PLAT|nr:hypothetical protein BOX15_Mlig023806g1 [Macrostomum lignano]
MPLAEFDALSLSKSPLTAAQFAEAGAKRLTKLCLLGCDSPELEPGITGCVHTAVSSVDIAFAEPAVTRLLGREVVSNLTYRCCNQRDFCNGLGEFPDSDGAMRLSTEPPWLRLSAAGVVWSAVCLASLTDMP